MKNNKHSLFYYALVAVIAGLIVGLGMLFFGRFAYYRFSFLQDLYLPYQDTVLNKDIVISQPRKVVIENDIQVHNIISTISPATVDFFIKPVTAGTQPIIQSLLTAKNHLGAGVVLTSDGWILTASELTRNWENEKIVVIHDHQEYSVTDFVSDPKTGLTFIKITSENLPVISLGNIENIIAGQQLVAYNPFYDLAQITQLKKKNYQAIETSKDFVSSTEKYDRSILLSEALGGSYLGVPVVDLNGELVGVFVDETGESIMPAQYIEPLLEGVFGAGEIIRIFAGIEYINIADVEGLSPPQRQELDAGALVTSLAFDSPLIQKLQIGDIIYQVEDSVYEEGDDLLNLLLQYNPGTEILLTYKRDGEQKDVSFTLQTLK